MLNRRQGLRAAFFASLITAGGGSVLAQQPETVGPPVLKDFQLEGQRTTPPAQPVPATTAPATTAPATTPPATPSAERPAPRPQATPTRRPARQAAPAAPAPVVAEPAPAESAAPTAPAAAAPLPAPAQPAPAAQAPVAASPAAQPLEGGWSWLWLAAPVALVLLGLLALRRRRREGDDQVQAEVEVEAAPPPAERPAVAATPPAPAPEAEIPPAPVRAVPAAPRARLEIEFRPERAAATESEAVVQFAMVLRNLGDAEAGNIRIDSRMFNASAEREIEAFLKGPIHEHSGSPQITIPPGDTLSLASAIKLPTSELREIELHGRRLFVPVAAINVAYDWADGGKGRTSRSWVIGREADQPSEKMGGFRLDLGPRIYRSVGQRPTRLAHVA